MSKLGSFSSIPQLQVQQAVTTKVEPSTGIDSKVNKSLDSNPFSASSPNTPENEENSDSSDDSLEEMPAALDLSISPDKSYLDIDSTFDNSFEYENSLDEDDLSDFDIPPPNSDALFETPFRDELAANSDSLLLATPPVPSPRKSSNVAPPSSRVVSGSLKIMKRRKVGPPSSVVPGKELSLKEAAPIVINEPLKPAPHLRITPCKSRSFSTPLINPKQRAPSLQDKPIPQLTHPAQPSFLKPPRSIKNMSARSVSHSFVSPISSFQPPVLRRRNSSGLVSLTGSSDSSDEESIFLSPQRSVLPPPNDNNERHTFAPRYASMRFPRPPQVERPRSASYQLAPPSSSPPSEYKSPIKKSPASPLSTVTTNLAATTRKASNTFNAPRSVGPPRPYSPFHRTHNDSKAAALSSKESLLDQEIMKLRKLLDTAYLAQSYQDSNEEKKLEELEEKWRGVAQKGASYLHNQAKEKVEQMGGMKEFLRRKKDDEEGSQPLKAFGEDSIDLDDMTPEEREQHLNFQEEYEEDSELDEGELEAADEAEEDPDEFTMKYMLKTLKIDYDVVFPDGYETDKE